MSSFSSVDESAHYGFSVCMLLEQYRAQLGWVEEGIVELGTGDATAIADVVRSLPGLRVRSYDISAPSVETARANIAARGVSDRYTAEVDLRDVMINIGARFDDRIAEVCRWVLSDRSKAYGEFLGAIWLCLEERQNPSATSALLTSHSPDLGVPGL